MLIARPSRHPARQRALRRPYQQGAVLIEALVAVLILMLGILALVGLQGRMIGVATDAQLRGEASYLADQLIGRMWVDQANVGTYAVTSGSTGSACTATNNAYCTAWVNTVTSTLPAGTATVSISGNVATVEIGWKAASSTTRRVQVSASFDY